MIMSCTSGCCSRLRQATVSTLRWSGEAGGDVGRDSVNRGSVRRCPGVLGGLWEVADTCLLLVGGPESVVTGEGPDDFAGLVTVVASLTKRRIPSVETAGMTSGSCTSLRRNAQPGVGSSPYRAAFGSVRPV